ncbi:molybdenum cofactor guanylyltransferase [Hwangdonia lutea]|uniref:Probable molybdenum cofactor guanylyltransferase n=1 Tax=Hwangdonia lutea TaxID=3075823 RepID=A0AA97EKH9_9FLAO|nr:molybdenum cofactor guanylyltransferase [Hwangdonia sp. SCSIO 19198]WOD43109.1 molybdenum cofactor guanylyltransferase [Hwangdonia sp. SCSIO 19198]
MIDKKHITGIILAGGKSSRMGTDKGFMLLNDKPFVQYSIDALKSLVSEIIIVSDDSDYDAFRLKRVNDITKNAGPIAGICSGLEASFTDYNLILSCDIPLISSEVLQQLIDAIDDDSEIIQIENQGKTMPLIALYKRHVKNKFKQFLQQDERRLRVAVKACKSKNIILEKEYEFSTMNVNTKEELKQVENVFNH